MKSRLECLKLGWQKNEGRDHKKLLVDAVETGLQSMIELLQKNHDEVREKTLLKHWGKVKSDYLAGVAANDRRSDETEQMQKIEELIGRYSNALAALATSNQKTRVQ